MILENATQHSQFAKFLQELTACLGNITEFERKIQQIAQIAHIPLAQYYIDHLAVRVNEFETALQWREMLSKYSQRFKENEVNGRPIGLFELNRPIIFLAQQVSVIELPFPKGKIYQQVGWEHIEIVIPMLKEESSEQWTARIMAKFSLLENPEIMIKVSQTQVLGQLLANPSIALTLKDCKTFDNFCCLKIHPYDIKFLN